MRRSLTLTLGPARELSETYVAEIAARAFQDDCAELYFDQIREALSLDAEIVAQAKANQLDNFRFGFEQCL